MCLSLYDYHARLPGGPPRPSSSPFPLLVPRTGSRLPFPGGPRAWRRPAGKLTRDSCSLPPAAPGASGFGRCGFSNRPPERQSASRGLKLVREAPGSAQPRLRTPSTIWSSVTVPCAAPSERGRGLLFQVPFTLRFPKIYYALNNKWNPIFRMLVCFGPHLLA